MMTFVPPYARTRNQAMITQAFAPKTLMGLNGCGCSGAAGADGVMRSLAGLGAANDPAAQRVYCADPNNRKLVSNGADCWDTCYKDGVPLDSTRMDPSECGVGTFFPAPVDPTKPTTPTSKVCDDTSLWKSGVASDGKCYHYCSADPLQYYPLAITECAKVPGSGTISGTTILMGALAAGVLLMLVTQ